MATLNTAIRGEQLQDASISGVHVVDASLGEVKLDVFNAPTDGDVLTYKDDTSQFEWNPVGTKISNEVPAGAINGANQTFDLSEIPIGNTLELHLNGLLQEPGFGNDYTISGSSTEILMELPPDIGDILLASYLISASIGGGIYTDHGNLDGLSDDDHPHYSRADGTRAFTGVVGGITPTLDAHLTTKLYVDDAITTVDEHSELGGLTVGDDHTQYILATGTRAFTGNILANASGTLDIGTSDAPFKDLYLTGASLYMDGNRVLYMDGDDLVLDAPGDVSFTSSGTQNMGSISTPLGNVYADYFYGDGSNLTGLVTDHGVLNGLSDDDHAQYILVDGTRAFTGDILPDASGTLNIGSAAMPFNNVYLNGASLYMNEAEVIYLVANGLVLKSPNGNPITLATNGGDALITDSSAGVKLNVGSQYVNEFSTDGTLAGDSDTAVSTEKAVKTYVDNTVITDHGGLGGLGDDDHTQYILVDGTRAFTGNILANASGTLDIGTSALPFKDLYLTGASLYMDGNKVMYMSGSDLVMGGTTGGAVSLYYNAALKFTTSNTGVQVDGVVNSTSISTDAITLGETILFFSTDDTLSNSSDDAVPTERAVKTYIDDKIIDHGGLVGLGDDDHSQYLFTDGSRALTSTWSYGAQDISGSGDIFTTGEMGVGTATVNARLEIEDGGTAKSVLLKVTADDQTPAGIVIGNDTYSTADTEGLSMSVLNGGVCEINAIGTNSQLALGSEDTEVIRIDENQNVGIGSNSPNYKLDVNGTVRSTGALRVEGAALIIGDLTVSGTTFTTNTETVLIEDNLLLINNGEAGAGVTVSGGLAGLEVDRGSLTNYRFVFDETDDNFQVGQIGELQAVATREDSPTASGIPYWNNSASRFDTTTDVKYEGGVLVASEMGIGVSSPNARLEVSDSGYSGSSVLLKVTADNNDPYGLVVGNDSYSTTDTSGVGISQTNGGTGRITNVGEIAIDINTSGSIKLNTGSQYVNEFSTDGTLAGNSDTALPTEKAVKTYVDALISDPENTDVDSGTETVDTFPDTDGDGCVWHYVVKQGTNLRTGTVMACWAAAGNTVEYTEVATNSLGSTTGLVLAVDISSDQVRLRATATGDNWSVKTKRMLM